MRTSKLALQQHAQDPEVLAAGTRRDPLRHLELDEEAAAADGVLTLHAAQAEVGGVVVGQVARQHEAGADAVLGPKAEGEGVVFVDGEAGVVDVGEALLEQRHEVAGRARRR